MAQLPGPEKSWRGIFPGTYLGNLWQTWNVDLERYPGRVVLSNHMESIAAEPESLGLIYKLLRTNALVTDQWFGVVRASTASGTDGDIVRNGNSVISAGTWITDDTAASPDNVHDMVLHESANGEERLLVTVATDIAILNKSGGANAWDVDWGSTVASGGVALSNTVYHPIARLQRLVAVGDKINVSTTNIPVIHTIDKDDVFTPNRLQFPTVYNVKNIYTSSNRFWLGLQHSRDGRARVIEWDGFSLTYNNEHDLVGNTPLCGFVVKDIPYFITEKGFIFKFDGGGFEKVQDFNLQEEQMVFDTSEASNATIKNYGATVDGNIVYINLGAPMRIESAATATYGVRRARSGVWIFNTVTENLYHHRGLGERLANSTKSFGSAVLSQPGTVIKATIASNQVLIATAQVYVGGATWVTGTKNVLYRDTQPTTSALNRGHIITPYIPIEEVEAMWESIWVKFKRFIDSGNRIVMKWRVLDPIKNQDTGSTNEYSPLQAAGTWVSTTTFTCAVPTGVGVGDEVEVISGDNAGSTFAITTLSATPDGSTTITVTIAEAASFSSTDTALFRFDNWRTETAISSTSVGNQRVPLTTLTTGGAGNLHGEFIQLKIELRGRGMILDEVLPAFKILTKVK